MGMWKTIYATVSKAAYATVLASIGCSAASYSDKIKENQEGIASIQSGVAIIDSRISTLESQVKDYVVPGQENQERHERNEQQMKSLRKRVLRAEQQVQDANTLSQSAEGAVAGMEQTIEHHRKALRRQGGVLNDLREYDEASRDWAERSDDISKDYFQQSQQAWRELREGWSDLSLKEQQDRIEAYERRLEELRAENANRHEQNGYTVPTSKPKRVRRRKPMRRRIE